MSILNSSVIQMMIKFAIVDRPLFFHLKVVEFYARREVGLHDCSTLELILAAFVHSPLSILG